MDQGEEFLNAARFGDLEKIARLLDGRPDLLHHRNGLGQSAILLAQYHRQSHAVELLLSRGVELDIFEAAAVGERDRVRGLAAGDASLVGAYSADGFTPLMLASFFGHSEIVEDLLAGGADVNAVSRNPMHLRALHSAAAARRLAIVRELVEKGADVNARQQQGFTALHAAADNGEAEMVRFLLEHGAEAGVRTDAGQTPLDLALTKGHAEAANLLR